MLKKFSLFCLACIMSIGVFGVSALANDSIEEDSTRVRVASPGRPGTGMYDMNTGKLVTYDEDGNEIVDYMSIEEVSAFKAKASSKLPAAGKRDETAEAKTEAETKAWAKARAKAEAEAKAEVKAEAAAKATKAEVKAETAAKATKAEVKAETAAKATKAEVKAETDVVDTEPKREEDKITVSGNGVGFVFIPETGELFKYDEDGNETLTILEGEELENLIQSKTSFSRSFDGTYYVSVPYSVDPSYGSVNVGNPFLVSPHKDINLQTFTYPTNMKSIDVLFTNEVGDDFKSFHSVPAGGWVWLEAKYPYENYVSKVSSFSGSFSSVKLRTFTD